MYLSELALHPLKSARRVVVSAIRLGALGPEGDRRWMLVDADGAFLTQRSHPRLCLLQATLEDGQLCLAAAGHGGHRVCPEAAPRAIRVQVWGDSVEALAPSAAADAWCSAFLGLPVRLAWMPDEAVRAVDARYAGPGHRTAFSDGFPLLLVTQSSLDHYNSLLAGEGVAAVDWSRFRPNLVVGGDLPPHAEDGWRRLRVGEVELALVKPCSRCVIPSIDPLTAQKDSRLLALLRRYRVREDGKAYFGQNVVVTAAPAGARLCRGDAVTVLE